MEERGREREGEGGRGKMGRGGMGRGRAAKAKRGLAGRPGRLSASSTQGKIRRYNRELAENAGQALRPTAPKGKGMGQAARCSPIPFPASRPNGSIPSRFRLEKGAARQRGGGVPRGLPWIPAGPFPSCSRFPVPSFFQGFLWNFLWCANAFPPPSSPPPAAGALTGKTAVRTWRTAVFWSGLRGSNSLPPPWQGGALPDELKPQEPQPAFGCLGIIA